MKRLRETEARTPLMHKAQALIDAVPPLPESRERMLRVRRELDRPRGVFAGLRRLPALVLAALIALFGASAFAAVRYLAARPELSAPAAQSASAEAAKPAHRAAKHDAQQSVAVPATAGAHTGSSAPAKPAAHATAPRAEARAIAARAIEAHAHSSDSALVHRALKALRRDGDAALAARLLDENRKRYPQGPLAEEALSLQIEAALALHDARARAFAREYLAGYPNGRYLAIAQRALEGAAP